MKVNKLAMLTDFYELTMGNGYILSGKKDQRVCFDMFFRKVPDDGGFAIMAGLDQIIRYLKDLKFEKEDIAFLREKNLFDEAFYDYLETFQFSCDVWAMPEGTPIFPNEPIFVVTGPVIQAQLIETVVLLTLNHQSLIATKANRIVRAAQGRAVMEFGSRRAHGYDGAVLGARAAFIGGCIGTSCTVVEQVFGIPAMGTMAHSWVQMYDSEYEAFKTYAEVYPDNCTLLVDTYNVLKSGVPNAIKVFDEVVAAKGYRPKGIRIDSGDITYLSKEARKMLDEAGYQDCKIVASNSLDEYIIRDIIIQGAKVDTFGVGERLITSKSEPVFGGVYKLSAVEKDGAWVPKMKLSENVSKTTIPGFKQVWRLFDRETGKAISDLITHHDEVVEDHGSYTIFDPEQTWKQKTIRNFSARPLLLPIFKDGVCVYETPTLQEIQAYCMKEIDTLWEEALRFENPHAYYVDLSQKLWDCRDQLRKRMSGL